MDAEEAYKIRLAGEINTNGEKVYFVQKYIKEDQYHSNICSFNLVCPPK